MDTTIDLILGLKQPDKGLLTPVIVLIAITVILDGYLAKKKGRLSSPVLVKSIPSVTVACKSDTITAQYLRK